MARLILMLLLALSLMGCSEHATQIKTHETIRIGDRDWTLELALDDAAITRGLMGRATATTRRARA